MGSPSSDVQDGTERKRKIMARRLLVALVWVSAVLFFGGCARGAPGASPKTNPVTGKTAEGWEANWEKTLVAARKEGEVLLYGNMLAETSRALPPAFQEKFGIKLDIVVLPGALGGTKLNSEYRAGIYMADAMIAGGTTLITMNKPEGNLTPMEPLLILPEVKDANAWTDNALPYVDKDTQALGFIKSYAPGVVRNTQMVKEGEVGSYRDLLKPQWKDKLTMSDPSIPGTAASGLASLVAYWGRDAALDYLKAVGKQDAILMRDQRLQVEWLARGKYPLALWPRTESLVEFILVGAEIAPIPISEGGLLSSGASVVGMPKKPQHPNAAIVFLNWLLSKEGQALYSKTVGIPSFRVDIPPAEGYPPIMMPPSGKKLFVDNEEKSLLERSSLMAEAGTIVSTFPK